MGSNQDSLIVAYMAKNAIDSLQNKNLKSALKNLKYVSPLVNPCFCIAVVKDKASTPSFAVGLLGMSMAALVAAIGASLRREEE